MANEYKQTMNLPKTKFPMRAALAQREPERLKRWQQNHVYELMLKKNEGHEKFVLHDGPPYANGPHPPGSRDEQDRQGHDQPLQGHAGL